MAYRIILAGLLAVSLLVGGTSVARAQENESGAASAPGSAAPAGGQKKGLMGGKAVVLTLAGTVDDYNRDALFRNFDKARQLGATVVILRVDTYGGLVQSALDISRFLKRQDDLHVIAFVDDKAISAGAMIALACDEIVMAPSSVLGDCAPIVFSTGGKLESLPAAERAKQESPILQDFEASARRNGYDPLVVQAMVAVQRTVYCVENRAGEKRFVDEATYKDLTVGGKKAASAEAGEDEAAGEKLSSENRGIEASSSIDSSGDNANWKPASNLPNPIDGPDTLLTVNTDQAIALGLSNGQSTSVEALAASRGYTLVGDLTPSVGDKLVEAMNHPAVRFILLLVFLQTLYIALHTPGHGAPEAVCLLALGLLVGIPLLTGYATWWEIAIIVAGLALVAFEIFVFPGHLVSLIVGLVMVFGGLLLTFVGDVWSIPHGWQLPSVWAGLRQGLWVIVGGLFCSVLLSLWLQRFLPKMPFLNRLILSTVSGGRTEAVSDVRTGRHPELPDGMDGVDVWPFVGTVGRAVSDLKPGGTAAFPFADDTRITAVITDSGYVRAGAKLAVREIRGNEVLVRPVAEPPA